ncbi:hypothetical protein T439DRAFT_320246, partial [Meredithblackwellia eburnea MCA 4105]
MTIHIEISSELDEFDDEFDSQLLDNILANLDESKLVVKGFKSQQKQHSRSVPPKQCPSKPTFTTFGKSTTFQKQPPPKPPSQSTSTARQPLRPTTATSSQPKQLNPSQNKSSRLSQMDNAKGKGKTLPPPSLPTPVVQPPPSSNDFWAMQDARFGAKSKPTPAPIKQGLKPQTQKKELIIPDSEDEQESQVVARSLVLRPIKAVPPSKANKLKPDQKATIKIVGPSVRTNNVPPAPARRHPSPLPPSSPPNEVIPNSDDEFGFPEDDFPFTASQFDKVEQTAKVIIPTARRPPLQPPSGQAAPAPPQPLNMEEDRDLEEDESILMPPPPPRRPGGRKTLQKSGRRANVVPSSDDEVASPRASVKALFLGDSPVILPTPPVQSNHCQRTVKLVKRSMIIHSSSPMESQLVRPEFALQQVVDADSSVEIVAVRNKGKRRMRRGKAKGSDNEDVEGGGDDSVQIIAEGSGSRSRKAHEGGAGGGNKREGAGSTKSRYKKKPKLTAKEASKHQLFDIEAVNSDESAKEASSEEYSSTDSEDRNFVAGDDSEDFEEDEDDEDGDLEPDGDGSRRIKRKKKGPVGSPEQRQFYLDSLASQAPQAGFHHYQPAAYRMGRSMGAVMESPETPGSQFDDLSYSYDSFCVADDVIEMEDDYDEDEES